MRQCPACKQTTSQVRVVGWILKIDTSILFDSDGEVTNVAPMRPIVMVKNGKEMDSPYVSAICPNCNYKGKVADFIPIPTCWLTGEIAVAKVSFKSIERSVGASIDVDRLSATLREADQFTSREVFEREFHV